MISVLGAFKPGPPHGQADEDALAHHLLLQQRLKHRLVRVVGPQDPDHPDHDHVEELAQPLLAHRDPRDIAHDELLDQVRAQTHGLVGLPDAVGVDLEPQLVEGTEALGHLEHLVLVPGPAGALLEGAANLSQAVDQTLEVELEQFGGRALLVLEEEELPVRRGMTANLGPEEQRAGDEGRVLEGRRHQANQLAEFPVLFGVVEELHIRDECRLHEREALLQRGRNLDQRQPLELGPARTAVQVLAEDILDEESTVLAEGLLVLDEVEIALLSIEVSGGGLVEFTEVDKVFPEGRMFQFFIAEVKHGDVVEELVTEGVMFVKGLLPALEEDKAKFQLFIVLES